MGLPPDSELRHAGAGYLPWLPLPGGDAAYVVGFLDDEGKRDTGYVYVAERDGKLYGEF